MTSMIVIRRCILWEGIFLFWRFQGGHFMLVGRIAMGHDFQAYDISLIESEERLGLAGVYIGSFSWLCYYWLLSRGVFDTFIV